MKSSPERSDRLASFTRLLIGVAALVVMAGCATNRYETGDAAAESLTRAHLAIGSEIEAFDKAMASLQVLVEEPGSNLQKAYAQFSRSVDRLSTATANTDRAIAEMRSRADAHLGLWDERINAMTFEVIREQSGNRREAVSKQVAELVRRHEETRAVVRPLIQYFEDLKLALAADLTLDGLANVRAFVSRTDDNVAKTRFALKQLANDLAATGRKISSTASLQAEAPEGVGGTDDRVTTWTDRGEASSAQRPEGTQRP